MNELIQPEATRTMSRAPRRKLHPQFRQFLREKIRGGTRTFMLAHIAGFPHYPDFSEVLNGPQVAASPLMVSRLERLAEATGYAGSIFAADDQVVRA